MCLKIFFARIIDVSLGTIRTVLVVKGSKITPAIVAFFEVLIWFIVAREALTTKMDTWHIPIFYAGGYATGTFIGTFVSNKFVDSLIAVQVIISENKSTKIIKEIKNIGLGVTSVKLNNTTDNKKKSMLIIELNKSRLKELTHIIRKNEPDAFLVINETKYIQNGIIRK